VLFFKRYKNKGKKRKHECAQLTVRKVMKLLIDNYSLLAIIIGVALISFSIGPFGNADTEWEYEAALGVINWGMPYAYTFGNMINQPPLGFYVEAVSFTFFGASINLGVIMITLVGFGCILTVYKIGDILYGKATALAASALFALSPWELILSRTFLIDVQCLFFSLLCVLVGIYAVRKDSFKLALVSGTLFAAAFLTKLFAVFTLLPLLLLFIYYRPKKLSRTLSLLGLFFLPAIFFTFLWYQVISGQGLLYLFAHPDFGDYNSKGIVPSYFFVGNFLLNYGLGLFFVSAAVFSLLICVFNKKPFSKIFVFDLICLVTIIPVVAANTFLGAGMNLKSPYNNAIKYAYQSLPFFSLLAASLIGKCLSLYNSAKSESKRQRTLLFSVVFIGIFLLGATMFVNLCYAHLLSKADYLLFKVEPNVVYGYSLFNPTPTNEHSVLMYIQYLGFAVVLSGLAWAGRYALVGLFERLQSLISKKDDIEEKTGMTMK
jgi:4-amino-4-deoxy-L-arabinose transferase-like glycosyltransferase